MIKNYVKVFEDGSQVATKNKPVFGLNNVRTEAGYNPDVYLDGKWYNSTNGNAVYDEDFTNDFDVVNWVATNGTSSHFIANLAVTSNGGSAYAVRQINGLEIGKEYTFGAYFTNGNSSGTGGINIGSTSIGYDYGSIGGGISQQIFKTFTAVSTSIYVTVYTGSGATAGQYVTTDNISLFETAIEPNTAYTSQPTYLPYVVNLDESGNVLDYDKFDIPTLVEDYVKADIVEGEHKGKNSCTAWVNFDGTTTPPTIRDSYNVSQVIRVATGVFDIYFEEPMDSINYTNVMSASDNYSNASYTVTVNTDVLSEKTVNKVRIRSKYAYDSAEVDYNFEEVSFQVFGGKN